MNIQLRDYAKQILKKNLGECQEAQQLIFKRMYAHGNLGMQIDDVVDGMPDEKLDWAMQQVQRTVDKNRRRNEIQKKTSRS